MGSSLSEAKISNGDFKNKYFLLIKLLKRNLSVLIYVLSVHAEFNKYQGNGKGKEKSNFR